MNLYVYSKKSNKYQYVMCCDDLNFDDAISPWTRGVRSYALQNRMKPLAGNKNVAGGTRVASRGFIRARSYSHQSHPDTL